MDEFAHLSFRLSDAFISQYETRPVDWGFPIGGGNTIGELTSVVKYARRKADGKKERWFETCRRVIEGMFSIQKDHCLSHRIPFNANKAQRAAEEAYERMFTFKWLPPGRGLWMMGTKFVWEQGSVALQNCMFISTANLGPRNPTKPFARLMEASMLGVGVGFDTLGAGKLTIHEPTGEPANTYVIPDTREGWCDSTEEILRSFLVPGRRPVILDYSEIRAAGEPIKGFGGVAAGPGPLMKLHDYLGRLFKGRDGDLLTSTDIVDVMNLIGKCVVAGNVRRSAELALGSLDDEAFLNLKNWDLNPERMGADGWGNLSNNTIAVEVGSDYSGIAKRIVEHGGEPGLYFLEIARDYGRLADPPTRRDYRVAGINPCAEQTLENNELCTLVEVFPTRHEDKTDFLRTLKFAYLYGKTVTLMPTHWEESNEVMTRNRRIGTSLTGVAQFADTRGWTALRDWCDSGYAEIKRLDVRFSEWLGVRESIKNTSVKPSGTVSRLGGTWPGVHWPVESDCYIRRDRYRADDPILEVFRSAGYHVEPDVMDPEYTAVVSFPTEGPPGRSEREVTLWEKVALAALMQRHWSDNAVSATFTFQEHERDQVEVVIRAFEGQLKTMSFLPLFDGKTTYAQQPYERVDIEEFRRYRDSIKPLDWEKIYASDRDAEGDRYCTTDVCEVRPS